ncbi:ABC-type transporter ATP-binding protein EcsA [Ruminiclostridium hungatei]|uniref:ABC-type transporter ATP-binding protein EcsA n=1 Tax=Ruminiclostridium hungatei TaxID=48256 RepID=A0A1V4SL04_RUMHU|nr:ABC transporter ATP-binding protein [Ruminiclostridium hungatei]OPX44494.1 ABC-type transporter ATP-binding protein EcsA [Ruminiclostridium hungatei]
MEEAAIAIGDLYMSYGEKQVINGISIQVPKGQIIGYIGPNGAGKSTTVKILLGLINNYKGSVKVLGEDISNGSVEYKRKIGYVPETAEIFDNLTAREYITFLGQMYGMDYEETDKKALKLMELFGIQQVYDSRITSYSKGMKQKVLLISSLIHNPEVLFLDEPLSGLDANSVMVFKEIMSHLAEQGKTIFYSSHIMEVVEKISHRIILINNGSIVADGTFQQLKEQSKEGSLEDIFNQLTGFDKHKQLAGEFVDVIGG